MMMMMMDDDDDVMMMMMMMMMWWCDDDDDDDDVFVALKHGAGGYRLIDGQRRPATQLDYYTVSIPSSLSPH